MNAPSIAPRDADGTQHPFMAFAEDDLTRAALARTADGRGWLGAPVFTGGISDAIKALDDGPSPKILIVDLTASEDPLADMERLAAVCEPGVHVITLGSLNDVQLYRALIDMGVDDYLLKPVTAETLNDAIDAVQVRPEPEPKIQTSGGSTEDGPGRLVAVVGARGGVGATTVALNTAWQLAEQKDRRVALVDLDLFFGSVALALDLESGRGFREALENPDRIDALFIERAMVRVSDNLFVLAAEESLERPFSFDPKALDRLIQSLRQDFDCVVLDLPRFAARTQMASLSQDGIMTIVSDPSLAGLRDTLRLARLVRDSGAELRTDILVSGIGKSKSGELSKADFERDGELTVTDTIPFDPKGMAEAAGAGKPLQVASKNSPALAVFAAYAEKLMPTGDEAAEQPFWRRLIKAGA